MLTRLLPRRIEPISLSLSSVNSNARSAPFWPFSAWDFSLPRDEAVRAVSLPEKNADRTRSNRIAPLVSQKAASIIEGALSIFPCLHGGFSSYGVPTGLVQGRPAMRVQDFGAFDGGVTLFGGPYSNLQALEALAERVEGPAICTGDVVAYGGDPVSDGAVDPRSGLARHCRELRTPDCQGCAGLRVRIR